MERAFYYRPYLTKAQTRLLERVLEIHRGLYNDALRERKLAWRMNRVTLSYQDQANQLKAIRAFDEDAAWVNYSSMQQTLRRLQKAYDAFCSRLKAGGPAGAPRYKSRERFRSVAYVFGDGVKLDARARRLYVQRVGQVRVFLQREPPAAARVKQVILHRTGNRWYATLQPALPDAAPAEPPTGEPVGIDAGLEAYAASRPGPSCLIPAGVAPPRPASPGCNAGAPAPGAAGSATAPSRARAHREPTEGLPTQTRGASGPVARAHCRRGAERGGPGARDAQQERVGCRLGAIPGDARLPG